MTAVAQGQEWSLGANGIDGGITQRAMPGGD